MTHRLHSLRRISQHRPWNLTPSVILAWLLFALIVGYTLLIPSAMTWSHSRQYWFWQAHAVVFAGITVIVIAAFRQAQAQPVRYRVVCLVAIVGHLLTVSVSLFDVSSYQSGAHQSILTVSMLLYLIIYLSQNFGLVLAVPFNVLPRIQILQIGADTMLTMSIVDVVLHLVLPLLITSWTWTPTVVANELRLAASTGVSIWLITVYRRFGAFGGRPPVLWVLGMCAMLLTDITFLGATFLMSRGQSSFYLGFGMPWWDMHQLLWSVGLYLAARMPIQWRTEPVAWPPVTNKVPSLLPARYSVIIVVLMILSSGVARSVSTTIWLVSALISREALTIYEREHLIRLQQASQADLLAANERLRTYAAQAEELATTQERNRVSREIHDGVGHLLMAINMNIEVARARLGHDPAGVQSALHNAQRQTKAVSAEVRRSIAALRSDVNTTQPLLAAIQSLAKEVLMPGIMTDVQIVGVHRPLTPQAKSALYRIAQEALTNIQKHSHATEVAITLDFGFQEVVRLVVQDNGVGTVQPRGGYGIPGVYERAQDLGGTATIVTSPGAGFSLTVEVPG
ncbi:MAG: hypothetical protein NVS4B8_28650 [Herpetosiphon sp.]